MDKELTALAQRTGDLLVARGLMLTTAESCTGGWVAQTATSVSGCSHWFERGFVTYSNAAKREMLGVREATLKDYGAVSEEVVREMADGAVARSHAQLSVAISGIAGPGGGTLEKPVGTVCLAWGGIDLVTRARTEHFQGDRESVRRQCVIAALEGVMELIGQRQ